MTRGPLLRLFLALALFGAACGTRVPEDQVEAAYAQQVSIVGEEPGLGSGVATEIAPGQQNGTPAGAPATQPGSDSAPPETTEGTACTSNPGATEVGVTGSKVVVGASYAESSLVPGQFRPAVDALQAYFNLINRLGGVCGRSIDFHFHNDELNAQRYADNVRHLVEQDKVFAMVGNLSAADNGACGYLAGERPPNGVPDIGTFALSYCRSQARNHYAPVGSLKRGIYGCCTEWDYLRDRFEYSRPAAHWLDIEISRDQGLAVVDALVRTLGLSGRGDVVQGEHSPAQFSYTGDVNSMRDAGVDAVWSSMDLNNNVKLLRAMCQQDWRPKVVHLEISAYDPDLIERVGANCVRSQNIWIRSFHRPFNDPNDELSLYIQTLREFCPACQPTTFGLEGWLAGKLFVEVLRAVGPDLSRERFYAEMDAVRDWTGGGVMGPLTPSKRLIYHCNYLLHVEPNGFFARRGIECGAFYASGDYDGPPVGP